MFWSEGILKTNNGNVHIEVDPELARYYRSQIPFQTNRQRYAPHITCIRNEKYDEGSFARHCAKEIPLNFDYDHYIYWNDTYVWLAVECPVMEMIRIVMGLEPVSDLTRSPDQQHKFHITLGNMK